MVAVAAAMLGLAAGWWWARKPETAGQTMLLTIAAPPGVELRHGIRGGSAISPDGTTVVFAGSRNGRSMLWLRSLKSMQARELPGTEAGALPFWSPDGKSIGFQAGGKIRRLDLPDGPVIELANASRPTRGGWTSDGSILFASGSGGPLLRVRSTGGAPTALAHTEGARWPSPLPGGGRFLFHENAGRRILMSSLEGSDQPSPLFAAESSAVYAPPYGGHPGKLLWMKGTALVAQTFDPKSGRLSGDVAPVIEDAEYADRWRMVDVTASMNGMLLIGAGNTLPSRLAWYNREGTRLEAVGEPEWLRTVRLTADGRKAVVEQGIPRALWLHDFESGVTARATFEPELSGWPVWSPDGKEIAYSGERNGRVALYARNAKGGGEERKLVSREFDDFLYDWSRDGSYLIYTEVNSRTKLDLWVLPLGGAPRPFRSTPFNEDWPQFSPDGRWVAYVSDESGRNEVYVTSFPNAEGKWQISTAGGITPRWCANGELFFESSSGLIMAAGTQPSARQFEWAAPRPLFRNPSPGRHYDVTPKADRFLMIAPVEDSAARSQLTLIVNWQAGLPR
jgi:Tol biopolymer transport system component